MSKYLTYEYLDSTTMSFAELNSLNESRKYSATVQVFLSHKHDEEKELMKKVKGFFYEQGAELYIDWQDSGMPKVTNAETAERIKQAISKSQKFIVLATPKSIESIWIPWELGIADKMKGMRHITLLPILHEGENWEKREYYNIYSRIEYLQDKWQVIEAQYNYVGTPLDTWLIR